MIALCIHQAALSGLSRGLDEALAASASMNEDTNALIRSMEEYSAIAQRQIADTAFFMTVRLSLFLLSRQSESRALRIFFAFALPGTHRVTPFISACPAPSRQFLESSDDEQSSCQAERHATNNYTVTFETGSRAVSSPMPDQQRRRQLLKAKGGSSDLAEGKAVWAGYNLGSVLDSLRFDEYGENVTELRKFLGPNKRANRLLGGMLLHQVRDAYLSESACDIGHPELSVACAHKLQADRCVWPLPVPMQPAPDLRDRVSVWGHKK